MSYGRTTYRSRRRMRVRTPITLLLLLAVLVGAGWYGVKQLTAPTPKAAVTTCTPRHVVSPTPGQVATTAAVTVNVYNAGSISGLADQTAAALKSRGFQIGTVGNDPSNSNFSGYLLVRGAARSLPAVRLLLAQASGSVFEKIARSDDTVDAVLGAKFRVLATSAPHSIPLVTALVTFPAGC